jgi:tetratricopeptide (TPR) repeat protein
MEELLEKQRSICGPAHTDTLHNMHQLALIYMNVNRFTDSIALHEKLLELYTSASDGKHDSTTWCMLTFAQACQRAGKLDQADRLLRGALSQIRNRDDSLGRRQGKANALGWLALNLLLQQKCVEAEPPAREAVAIFEKDLPDERQRFYWISLLGAVLLGQHRYSEAEPLLLQGYEGLQKREASLIGGSKHWLAEAGERIVRFYKETRQPEKVREWQAKLSSATPLK